MNKLFLSRLALGLLLFLPACNPTINPANTPTLLPLDEASLLQTSVARVTAEAVKTRQPVISILSPTETLASVPLTATNTPFSVPDVPTITSTPNLPCNLVQAGNPIDVSVPDGSRFLPGQEFVKTWRIINGGNCTWTMRYKYSYYSGNSMGAHQENRLITEVQPGQAVDISVPFIAPFAPGEYEGSWMMQDETGNFFGMGLNADAPFYVKIRVEAAP